MLPPRVLPPSPSPLSVSVTASKSDIHLWKQGIRMVILLTKRLVHNHAPSLLDFLSYGVTHGVVGAPGSGRASALSQGSRRAGGATATRSAPQLRGQDLWGSRGQLARPAPSARGHPAHQAVPGAPRSGWGPSPTSTRVSKNPAETRPLAHCLPGLAPRTPEGGRFLHAVTPEPSNPLIPLSYRWQTWGCSLFHSTHRNYHLLPIILKLIFGSEQTPRGVKAPDKKSVSL